MKKLIFCTVAVSSIFAHYSGGDTYTVDQGGSVSYPGEMACYEPCPDIGDDFHLAEHHPERKNWHHVDIEGIAFVPCEHDAGPGKHFC